MITPISEQRRTEAELKQRIATSTQDYAVITAWKNSQAAEGSGGKGAGSQWLKNKETDKWEPKKTLPDFRLRTNGKDLFSYGHKIGTTSPDGKKVVFSCSKNQFTKKHCLDARSVADFVRVVCPSCHKGDEVARTNVPLAEDESPYAKNLYDSGQGRIVKNWKEGKADVFNGKNKDEPLKTDGQKLWSYGHELGDTWPDGTKVSYNCRRTNNGNRPAPFALAHTKLAGKFSDQVLPSCPSCHPELAAE